MDLEKYKIKAPFTVPKGYFEGMEDNLLSEVKISSMSALSLAQVSQGYFKTLEEQVLSTTRITGLSAIDKLPTPQNYFENMESHILSLVEIDGITQQRIDEAYFAELEETVLRRTQLEAMNKVQELPVPENYFENLESSVLDKTENKPKFKLFRNLKVLRNAAAVAILAIAAYSAATFSPAPKDELADISSEAMVAYLSEQPLMVEDLQFLITEDVLPAEVTDSDISNYLIENGI